MSIFDEDIAFVLQSPQLVACVVVGVWISLFVFYVVAALAEIGWNVGRFIVRKIRVRKNKHE